MRVRVRRAWLDGNGRLPICLAKPPKRVNEIATDGVAQESSVFLRSIVQVGEQGYTPLRKWFGSAPGLLVFPEYAFSSQDFPLFSRDDWAATDAAHRARRFRGSFRNGSRQPRRSGMLSDMGGWCRGAGAPRALQRWLVLDSRGAWTDTVRPLYEELSGSIRGNCGGPEPPDDGHDPPYRGRGSESISADLFRSHFGAGELTPHTDRPVFGRGGPW